jgi:hypothetical protein
LNEAEKMIKQRDRIQAVPLDATQPAQLAEYISKHDLIIR